jgi:hypothetical protein
MRDAVAEAVNRRRFLRLLAASPLLGLSGSSWAGMSYANSGTAQDAIEDAIATPEQALNVMEFEAAARKKLPPAHFGYMATGVEDDGTLRANREGFERFQLRVRRLRDVRKIDTSVRLFGAAWDTPIALAPVGSQKAFHSAGEIAVAKAARAKGCLQILSTMSSSPVEAVNEAMGAPVWYQLYPTNDWNVTRGLTKRAEAAGCPVLVLTVDLQAGSNRESFMKSRRVDVRPCADCHTGGFAYNTTIRRRPMFQGLDLSKAWDERMPASRRDASQRAVIPARIEFNVDPQTGGIGLGPQPPAHRVLPSGMPKPRRNEQPHPAGCGKESSHAFNLFESALSPGLQHQRARAVD